MNVTSKQRRHLKSLGHHLDPVVQLNEIGEGVLKEIDTQLQAHELIKIRFGIDERAARLAAIKAVSAETGAECVQHIGKIGLFYRPNPDRAHPIELPRD